LLYVQQLQPLPGTPHGRADRAGHASAKPVPTVLDKGCGTENNRCRRCGTAVAATLHALLENCLTPPRRPPPSNTTLKPTLHLTGWIAAVHDATELRHGFLGTEIRIAFQAMERAFASRTGMKLAPAHGTLLLIALERPNLTQQQLSEAIGLQRSTMTRAIDTLQRQGLVERHVRRGDRRSYAIRVTTQGARLARRLRPIIFELEAQLDRGLGRKRRELLIRLLREAQDVLWKPPRESQAE
jgi:DNA-binding MarR family transcriptional regulator